MNLEIIEGYRICELEFFLKNKLNESAVGCADLNHATDWDKRRLPTSYVFYPSGNVIVWKTTLQFDVALSIIEVEYITIIEVVKRII